MSEQDKIQLFENQPIRAAWDSEQEEWYFSIVDVIKVLTGSPNPQTYWRVMKKRLKDEGNETVTNCNGLKMVAADGKRRMTDVATTEQLLRLIQSIPSPKAEPFKLWLAQVGRERIEETIDPEQAIDRALETYQRKGYSPDWIHQRILAIRVRNELTAEWQARGVEQGREYAILTDEITRAWSGMTTKQYKQLKNLKKQNLRDNMSTAEIVLNMLAEVATTELSKGQQPEGFAENKEVARRGGRIAGQARQAIEADSGQPVITSQNAAQLNAVVTQVIETVAASQPEELPPHTQDNTTED
ncbi:Bro-N domain-containing protein [Oscillospiraceae bacterium 50-16]